VTAVASILAITPPVKDQIVQRMDTMKTSNARRFGVAAAALVGLLGAIANAGHHGESQARDSVDTAIIMLSTP
jgi:hypothetical protein